MNKIGLIYNLLIQGGEICTDSRLVSKNSIFVALKGEHFDGNAFALNALSRGAVIAIVDDTSLKEAKGTLLVDNTLVFLQELAKHHRENISIPIIGLTGSNGKTTTKELLNKVLSKKYKTFATKGNLNNHIGVPLSVLMINPDDEMAIIEMGANHIGEIALLCSIAQPTHGLITNIGKAHLEGFGSIEGVIKAKTELYSHLSSNHGTVFYNSNNPLLSNLIGNYRFAQAVNYGSDAFCNLSTNTKNGLLSISGLFEKHVFEIETKMVGEYNVENVLAAISVGKHFGVSLQKSTQAIVEYEPTNSRSQMVRTKKNLVILDAYNANPSSMELALQNFHTLPTEYPKCVILGDMLEMGDYSKAEHTRIGNIAKSLFKKVILVGENFKHVEDCLWFPNQTKCGEYLNSEKISQHAILLKASRGVRLDKVIDYL